jgi:hypothetical protein
MLREFAEFVFCMLEEGELDMHRSSAIPNNDFIGLVQHAGVWTMHCISCVYIRYGPDGDLTPQVLFAE